MAYEYRVNEQEAEARNYLKDRGWKVEEPPCPECFGHGTVIKHNAERLKKKQLRTGKKYVINFYSEPCPNDCPAPAGYY